MRVLSVPPPSIAGVSHDHLVVRGAREHNLKDISIELPRDSLVVFTGLSGSGKSSLAAELLTRHDAVAIDQKPVSGNRRSTPITYTGIATPVRRLFARENDVPASLFSANSEGACPDCDGLGVISTDLGIMASVDTPCEACP